MMKLVRASVSLAGVLCAVASLEGRALSQDLPSKPLRHLEYFYSVDYQNLGSQDTGAIGTRVGSGIARMSYGVGRQGKLLVDVLAAAKDGGLVIRVAEWVENQPRPEQSFICAVYPNTSVMCPPELPVTDVETTMLEYLGRGFVNPAAIDGNNQWQTHFSNKYVNVAGEFTVSSTDTTGKVITVDGQSTTTSATGTNYNWVDKSKIVYDVSREVPTSVEDTANQSVRGAQSYKTYMRFSLTSDSLPQ